MLGYVDSELEVREDLTEAHREAWRYIAAPGPCLESSLRLAVAREARIARDCDLCTQRKQALSPYSVEGQHTGRGELPAWMEEVVHRVVTDPGRITEAWTHQLLKNDASDQAYVEVVSIVSVLLVVDTFNRALGLPLRPLPDAVPGGGRRADPLHRAPSPSNRGDVRENLEPRHLRDR